MNADCYLGIDLGGTNCRIGLVTATGELLARRFLPTDLSAGLEAFVRTLGQELQQLAALARSRGLLLRGGGIGIPGVIADDGRIAFIPNLPQLQGVALANRMQAFSNAPLLALNDANAIALGEAHFGAGRGFLSSLTVTLGTGVGGGLLLAGTLWCGPDGSAGEIGHFAVEAEGRLCGCGARGCLERYASATGILASVAAALQVGAASVLKEAGLSCEAVAVAARQGDAVAIEAFEIAGQRLGQVLAGVVNLLNLEALIFCGGVSASFDLLRPALESELHQRLFVLPRTRLQILTGTLGDTAGILGAAWYARACLPVAEIGS